MVNKIYINKNNLNLIKKQYNLYISYKSNYLIAKISNNILITKGIFFRKLKIIPSMYGKNIGSYVNSRKPNTRLFKKKKR